MFRGRLGLDGAGGVDLIRNPLTFKPSCLLFPLIANAFCHVKTDAVSFSFEIVVFLSL